MYKIKTKAFGRVAAAVALSFGLAASAVSVASASSHGHHSSRHDGGALTSTQSNRVEGTVSAYTAATGATNGSITILSKHGTSTTYVTTTATTITGLAAGATLVSPDRVMLKLSTTTPVTVTSIKVQTPCAAKVEGTVSAYTAAAGATNGSITILSKHGTSTTYVTTTATTITGLAAGATLVSPDRVKLGLSTTTPVTVTSIKVQTPCAAKVEGTVSAYTAAAGATNGSITILSKHGTSTTYVTTTATTITGLAAGATLVSPDRVKLELSTTTPVTVTSIKVDNHGSKYVGSKGNESSNSRGSFGRDSNSRSFSNGGSSKNGNFRK